MMTRMNCSFLNFFRQYAYNISMSVTTWCTEQTAENQMKEKIYLHRKARVATITNAI